MQAMSARMGTAGYEISGDLPRLPFPILGFRAAGEKVMPSGVYPRSEETRRVLSDSHKGKTLPEEQRRKISISMTGKKNCLGRHLSEKHRENISLGNKGKLVSEETRRKMSESNTGHVVSEDQRQKLRQANLGKKQSIETIEKRACQLRGEKHYNWQGGISFEPYCIKFTNEFKERVRLYFNHTCTKCGTHQNGERLHIHHVNFNKESCCDSSIPLFVPLCRSCHSKTNHNRPFWEYWFTEMINRIYDGKCYFTKEEMETYDV